MDDHYGTFPDLVSGNTQQNLIGLGIVAGLVVALSSYTAAVHDWGAVIRLHAGAVAVLAAWIVIAVTLVGGPVERLGWTAVRPWARSRFVSDPEVDRSPAELARAFDTAWPALVDRHAGMSRQAFAARLEINGVVALAAVVGTIAASLVPGSGPVEHFMLPLGAAAVLVPYAAWRSGLRGAELRRGIISFVTEHRWDALSIQTPEVRARVEEPVLGTAGETPDHSAANAALGRPLR